VAALLLPAVGSTGWETGLYISLVPEVDSGMSLGNVRSTFGRSSCRS
jgi:hypothetical protein